MTQKAALVVGVALLVVASWALGRAQTAVADFQFSVSLETAPGAVRVTCDRGCDWSPSVADLECDSQPCRWTFTGYGPVTLGIPRGAPGPR
jgi:hypothetical protein